MGVLKATRRIGLCDWDRCHWEILRRKGLPSALHLKEIFRIWMLLEMKPRETCGTKKAITRLLGIIQRRGRHTAGTQGDCRSYDAFLTHLSCPRRPRDHSPAQDSVLHLGSPLPTPRPCLAGTSPPQPLPPLQTHNFQPSPADLCHIAQPIRLWEFLSSAICSFLSPKRPSALPCPATSQP